MDSQRQGLPVAGTVILGNENACTHGDAAEQARQHKDQVAGGTDGRKGLLGKEVADDEGVGGIIKLLRNITNQHWNSKFHQTF